MKCKICGEPSVPLHPGVCRKCLLEKRRAVEIANSDRRILRVHAGLPPEPPHGDGGIECCICANGCILKEGSVGYCGLRYNRNGKIYGPDKNNGILHAYYDANPTNCCAAWFCPAGTGIGYPRYSVTEGRPEYGTYNYSVFFYGCGLDCLYCQNYEHKITPDMSAKHSKDIDTIFNEAMRKNVTCICFFGGSPEPQLPFALNLCRKITGAAKERGLIKRICWEWNGYGNSKLMEKAARYSLISGGTVKFDLKAFTPAVYTALTGCKYPERIFSNFKMIAELIEERPEVPLLTATTLLVPGYIDAEEVEKIAEFIASINDKIPYSLLVFHPDYIMKDLPVTPRETVKECYKAALRHLKRVNVGNLHLIGLSDITRL